MFIYTHGVLVETKDEQYHQIYCVSYYQSDANPSNTSTGIDNILVHLSIGKLKRSGVKALTLAGKFRHNQMKQVFAPHLNRAL